MFYYVIPAEPNTLKTNPSCVLKTTRFMQKHIYAIIFLWAACSLSLFSQDIKTSNTDEMDSLATFFDIDNELLYSCILRNPHYIRIKNAQPSDSFTHERVLYYTANNDSIPNFLIITNDLLYDSLQYEIKRYAEDIHAIYGYGIMIEKVTAGSPEQIKSLIITNKENLCGAIFIGDIGEAYFETANDFNKYGYRKWACDLFFMDIDGQWIDSDNNGIYDIHQGNMGPEIFIGRLSTKGMASLNEAEALRIQLQKSHSFWWNSSYQNANKSLRYTNKDWINSSDINSSSFLAISGQSNTDTYKASIDSIFSSTDYIKRLSANTYKFTQLAAHSNQTLHQFPSNNIYVSDIAQCQSSNIAYNLFCCSACNWIQPNSSIGYLGGTYLFYGNKTLSVIGSTKTGSMLYFSHFYTPISNGFSIGNSFLNWWKVKGNTHNSSIIWWFYGMSILGDPCINFRHNVNEYCTKDLKLKEFPKNNKSNMIMYKAENSITLTGNFIIPKGVHVILDAPNISFESGFCCPQGASLETRNEGCVL